jgi:hypothetical protein
MSNRFYFAAVGVLHQLALFLGGFAGEEHHATARLQGTPTGGQNT